MEVDKSDEEKPRTVVHPVSIDRDIHSSSASNKD